MDRRASQDSTTSETEIPLIESRKSNDLRHVSADDVDVGDDIVAISRSDGDDAARYERRSDETYEHGADEVLSQKELRDVRRFELVGMFACCTSIFGEHRIMQKVSSLG